MVKYDDSTVSTATAYDGTRPGPPRRPARPGSAVPWLAGPLPAAWCRLVQGSQPV